VSTPTDREIYEKIRREHDHLRELLGKIHQALSTRAETVDEISGMMTSLQEHLREHFHEEEDGGFFKEIVSQAPRMSDRADAIENEHVDLSTAVDELVSVASKESELCKTMEAGFHDFSKALMHHETKENELLLDAYEEDIGSAD
jgi:iron-sulfur cluster repair protein YtfE (RIC family)